MQIDDESSMETLRYSPDPEESKSYASSDSNEEDYNHVDEMIAAQSTIDRTVYPSRAKEETEMKTAPRKIESNGIQSNERNEESLRTVTIATSPDRHVSRSSQLLNKVDSVTYKYPEHELTIPSFIFNDRRSDPVAFIQMW